MSYGGINAVKGINLNIRSGELVALIAPTALADHYAQSHQRDAAAIRRQGFLCGADVTGTTAHQLVRKGLALVPEGRGVFNRLTVEENLQMGAYIRNDKGQIKQDLDRVYDLFERVYERRAQKAGTLSGGEQQWWRSAAR